ncbi:MAG: class I mannose-6-phosphate isomerase [Cytophagales bacterium]|nr:class I mannose-6-phosphate isomerase [Cytophagales bacterium]MDW8383158.1 mannose-6-phosphate isomerase [Flammeovirgaceae bacterium]
MTLAKVRLYPLKFETIFKNKIWGGQKIRTILGKDFGNLPNCGETWEISGVKGNISVVQLGGLKGKNLVELIDIYKGELVGHKIYKKFGDEFPLLVKFIDANDDLSIQVHPNDELARKRHNSFGKTEMWYILQADKGASLISGFKKRVTKEEYLAHLERKTLEQILNREAVEADDVFFLPAGRVHTIGKGLLLAEIQQSSDITYRIYDFDRRDEKGNLRELHTELALDAIDFDVYPEYKTRYEKKENAIVELVSCPYFTTNLLHFSRPITRNYSRLDSFVIYVCMEGSFTIRYDVSEEQRVQKGECVLLPADIKQVELIPETSFKILESYIL